MEILVHCGSRGVSTAGNIIRDFRGALVFDLVCGGILLSANSALWV